MTPLERRALARRLSRIADAGVAEAIALDQPLSDACQLIGVTGPPGAGKSTLIARLAHHRVTEAGLAIIAIDPSSPITGGALLGDRIRMADLVDDARIFIRSLATRGSLDGLADNLPLILHAVAAAGFAEIIVETVGVGQVEYAVRRIVDTMVLVLTPGAGDQIQAMKSGILETPDIIVINKADQPGAEQLTGEIGAIVRHRKSAPDAWTPPILSCAAERDQGLSALAGAIDAHRRWLADTDTLAARRQAYRRQVLSNLVARRADEILRGFGAERLGLPLSALFAAIGDALNPIAAETPRETAHGR